MKKLVNDNILRDALYNLSPANPPKPEYNRGLVVGIVSVLEAQGLTFGKAIEIIAEHLPKIYNDHFPDTWAFDLNSKANKLGKVPTVHPAIKANEVK